ncbi:hypothetical protein GQ53DRAFT_742794 [Thozetella sp. PMI_491]|nr:hypothetical protein GQ53DRAFT_742794 [Thozetella sp. PMI_491]
MRLSVGVPLALAAVAASASQEVADVFVLDRHSQSSARGPRIPKEIARHIMLQRASTGSHGHLVHDIPNTIDETTAIEYVNSYGKRPAPLFDEAPTTPSQLVVILEGVTPENSEPLRDILSQAHRQPSFSVADPPSTAATARLMDDFRAAGVSNDAHCDFESAVNPFDKACWQGTSAVVWYDAKKKSATIDAVIDNLARLNKFVAEGDVEAILVLLPESTRSSHLNSWHSALHHGSPDLRRRDFKEHVMTDDTFEASSTKTPKAAMADTRPIAHKIPACFTTQKECTNQTNSCSGHGECVNKYGNKTEAKCFVCHCQQTVRKTDSKIRPEEIVEWGGAMCQKEDISAAFWLIAGFTIVAMGAVAGAIGLLFNMGQEKLPGVIGAGVNRSK